ncbi:MAG: YgeY family selenium metabolism-linked hydrolase [Fretibacterium sp.]|nr:YgeY family selenium metabolism-linked hydrolase [Fretibacterium sp.]
MNENLVRFAQRAVQTRSYSDEEGEMAHLVEAEMKKLGYDEVWIDKTGNVIGRIGSGTGRLIQFDSHMDTVRADDADAWTYPPFEGKIVDGWLWGRGSVDMKSSLCASVHGVALARDRGWLKDKSVCVTGTVCEEYCDGENLKHFYKESGIRPDFCIICEPSGNVVTLGHKGKAQVRVTTHGVSAHGSAPEKGRNAVYEMAEIIQRVEALNTALYKKGETHTGKGTSLHGTIVLSDISCVSASLNAVPGSCSIYLDRRLAWGETLEGVRHEMDVLIAGKDALWEVGTLRHRTWTGEELVYEPMHNPWRIEMDHPLTQAMTAAYRDVYGRGPDRFDFWDFGTNAITPVALGIPTIGFGCGEYKLAHMRDEKVELRKVEEAAEVYANLIREL